MIKLLIGGSPCTFWSIAQKNGRETEAKGMGWELFKNYLIAKEKFKPDFFLYENNKSAAQAIKDQISRELGVELMYINSALVSAQNRQRFYAFNWEVEQPEDRGILLRDILETGEAWREKVYCIDANYYKGGNLTSFEKQSGQRLMAAEPVNVTADGKAQCLRAAYYKDGIRNLVGNTVDRKTCVAEPICLNSKSGRGGVEGLQPSLADRIYSIDGKHTAVTTCFLPKIAEPIRIGTIESEAQNKAHDSKQYRVYSPDGKSTTLCGQGGGVGAKTGLYATPVMRVAEATKQGYVDIEPGECVDLTFPNSKTRRGRAMKEKSNCLTTGSAEFYEYCGTVDKPIYEVKNGFITIKGKKYPIKLKDGYYVIRKLTPIECERLQTMPDGYTRAVSNTQRYKGLGNGWTAEVIIHILNGVLKDISRDEEIVVLSMYDGIGTGRYCLDKMGFTNVKYYAYEIDKYAMQVAMSNYPDIIQMGDAFELRNPDWTIGY